MGRGGEVVLLLSIICNHIQLQSSHLNNYFRNSNEVDTCNGLYVINEIVVGVVLVEVMLFNLQQENNVTNISSKYAL